MTIGERIKQLRIQCGLTQDELANCIGTTKQTIHKYETGIISNIPSSKILIISEKLNTTPAYLFGWDNIEQSTESPPKNTFDNNIVRLIGRDGTYIEKRLTDEQVKALEMMVNQLPEASEDL